MSNYFFFDVVYCTNGKKEAIAYTKIELCTKISKKIHIEILNKICFIFENHLKSKYSDGDNTKVDFKDNLFCKEYFHDDGVYKQIFLRNVQKIDEKRYNIIAINYSISKNIISIWSAIKNIFAKILIYYNDFYGYTLDTNKFKSVTNPINIQNMHMYMSHLESISTSFDILLELLSEIFNNGCTLEDCKCKLYIIMEKKYYNEIKNSSNCFNSSFKLNKYHKNIKSLACAIPLNIILNIK
jgi:hypothetical protein